MMINTEKDKFSDKYFSNKGKKTTTSKIIKIVFFIVFVAFIINYILIFNVMKRINNISERTKIFENFLKNKNIFSVNEKSEGLLDVEFDEKAKNKYIENQLHFCNSNDLFNDPEIENRINKVKASLNGISFDMYVYKNNDVVSKFISNVRNWEATSTNYLIKSLDYYSQKKKLSKNDITILDIGANVGWYSFYFSKMGYELISFEVSHTNDYILKKNFCLNKDSKITIINKGIGLKEEKCLLRHPPWNEGNGIILCGDNNKISGNSKEYLTESVEFTKLSNYIPYLSKKNLALIKLDVEGSEGKVINSGIELITKYHVPFLFAEFNIDYLKMQGTDPKTLLEIFINNDYLISTYDFLSKRYSSVDDLLKISRANLYIVYSKFLE